MTSITVSLEVMFNYHLFVSELNNLKSWGGVDLGNKSTVEQRRVYWI